jgi:5-methylcytosine-specific restriction endonuclease McrA
MPKAAPVHRHDGYRTAAQRKNEVDQHRIHDPGRAARKALYDSRAWQELRDLARVLDPFCVDCKASSCLVPWTDLDHIVDMANGGEALSLDNVIGRCKRHHSAKTARTRGFHRGRP